MALSRLDDAIRLAVLAHAGQTDLADQPYILHPLRVMLAMETEDERVAAVLHDVLEDCSFYTAGDIRFLFGDTVADAVIALTRLEGEAYSDFIIRCRENPIAARVKVGDIKDNMSPSRSSSLKLSHKMRYEAAIKTLSSRAALRERE